MNQSAELDLINGGRGEGAGALFVMRYVIERDIVAPDAGEGTSRVRITTERPNWDGNIVRASGGHFEDFLHNPVVMYVHDYQGLPVAKGTAIAPFTDPAKGTAGMLGDMQFAPWGVHQLADQVHKLWDLHFLNAVSIGFNPRPGGMTWLNDGQNWEAVNWDLLEWSICPVPMNPDALRENAIRQALSHMDPELRRFALMSLYFDAAGTIAQAVIPYKDTGKSSLTTWSAPLMSDFTDKKWSDLSDSERNRIAEHYTWSAHMPPQAFGDLKLPHHDPSKSGVGPANKAGVNNAKARALQKNTDIPNGATGAILAHLDKHEKQWKESEDPDADLNAQPISEAELDVLGKSLNTLTQAIKEKTSWPTN